EALFSGYGVDPFFNVNTPEDLAQAAGLLKDIP
ncbi:MAG: molybdenum cofactor guanylyltransferase MobA, partial [Rhodobacteraceae bacterium]|nr:molybdenum cofactor guanylyltransferase MobA [Paracoccaceae bacterium]